MSEVTDLLDRLVRGDVDIGEVESAFATRQWPRHEVVRDPQAQGDPEPDEPGSFAEVEQAYVDGRITREQYRRLVEAYAGATTR